MRIAVTGSTGFIGRHLLAALDSAGHEAIPLARADLAAPHDKLPDAPVLVHLAGLAHTRAGRATYDAVNRDLPVALAETARRSGIKRFVFVSSINAATAPQTPYGASKAEAERRLLALADIEVVIVRPAPVYGVGARGNFAVLQRLAASPWPLPFAGTRHRRSIIAVINLADALVFAATQPGVGGQTFAATDPGPAPTLARIITALRRGMGRRPALFPGLADLVFAQSVIDGNALVAAGWQPPLTSDEALATLGRALASAP